MTLREIYAQVKATPVKRPAPPTLQFVREVAEVTKKSEMAVRRWLGGQAVPDALTQEVLARHFNTTPEQLFPTTTAADATVRN